MQCLLAVAAAATTTMPPAPAPPAPAPASQSPWAVKGALSRASARQDEQIVQRLVHQCTEASWCPVPLLFCVMAYCLRLRQRPPSRGHLRGPRMLPSR